MKIFKYFIEAILVYFLFFVIKIFGLKLGRKIITPLFSSIGFFLNLKKLLGKISPMLLVIYQKNKLQI